jgi:hypothetical protein
MSRTLRMAVLLVSIIAFAASSENDKDSAYINKLLAIAKTNAAALQQDAQQLESYTRSSGLDWQIHASKLEEMKKHVNQAGDLLRELRYGRQEASPWQKTAIDRITPILQEMAHSLQRTFDTLNQNQSRIHVSPYKDYAVANAELANDLAQMITDFMSYGRAKAKFEKLGEKLEISQR